MRLGRRKTTEEEERESTARIGREVAAASFMLDQVLAGHPIRGANTKMPYGGDLGWLIGFQLLARGFTVDDAQTIPRRYLTDDARETYKHPGCG